jgi:hypothetical protein
VAAPAASQPRLRADNHNCLPAALVRLRIADLERSLGQRVIGQPEAVAAVAAAIRRARAGMQ